MCASRIATAVLVAGAALLSACGMCGKCPELTLTPLESGTYRAKPASKWQKRSPKFAHHGGTDKTVHIDRAKGIVEFRYLRDGKKVVERWRIRRVTQVSR